MKVDDNLVQNRPGVRIFSSFILKLGLEFSVENYIPLYVAIVGTILYKYCIVSKIMIIMSNIIIDILNIIYTDINYKYKICLIF